MPAHAPVPSTLAFLAAACVLTAGCAGRPEAVSAATPPDYDIIMGEIALLRDMPRVAVEQYLHAARRLDDPAVARRGLMVAIHAGDLDSARVLAARWEALAPDDPELMQYQAILTFRAGETDAAFGYLLRVADGAQEEGDVAAVRANLQLITGLLAGEDNVWRAADLMARLAAARPDHPEGWYGAALLALEANRPAVAERFAARALDLQPGLRDAVFLRARAALAANPEDSARVLAPLRAYRNDPDPGVRYRYAGLLVLAGRSREADALFQDILVNDPDQHDARLARALLALEEARDETAAAELHALLDRHGRVPDAMYFLGVLAEQRGDFDGAAAWYGRVAPVAAEPGRWLEAQTALARTLLNTGGLEEAMRYFDDLRAAWPEQAHELTLREAGLLTTSGHPQLALARLDALAADPTVNAGPALDWQLGITAAEAGHTERAEAYFRGLLAREPDNPVFMNALAWLLIEHTDRLGEAQSLLERALAAAPANAAILDSAGWLRFRQGDAARARPLLEESWRREPAALTGLHLLEVLEALGDDAAYTVLRLEMASRFPAMLAPEPAQNQETE